MRFFFTPLLLTLLPAIALAQYSDAPMVVVNRTGPQVAQATATPAAKKDAPTPQVFTPDFPEWAVTQVGANSTGIGKDTPATPATPAAPAAAPTAATPPTPAAPPAPESPISKLWPADTVPIFMRSCTGYHVELVPACSCIITKLIPAMGHDEFMKLSANGSIEQDPRLLKIREGCISAQPEKKGE